MNPKTRCTWSRCPQFHHALFVLERKPVVRQRDLKLLIKRQERLKQVLLVQGEPALDQPLGWIVVREEDVMHVHPDAGREAWQDFQKLVTDVTAKLHGVAGVDKKNVVGCE